MPKTKVTPVLETKAEQEKDSTSSLFYFVSFSVVVFYLILAKGPSLIISADDMESYLTLTIAISIHQRQPLLLRNQLCKSHVSMYLHV